MEKPLPGAPTAMSSLPLPSKSPTVMAEANAAAGVTASFATAPGLFGSSAIWPGRMRDR